MTNEQRDEYFDKVRAVGVTEKQMEYVEHIVSGFINIGWLVDIPERPIGVMNPMGWATNHVENVTKGIKFLREHNFTNKQIAVVLGIDMERYKQFDLAMKEFKEVSDGILLSLL